MELASILKVSIRSAVGGALSWLLVSAYSQTSPGALKVDFERDVAPVFRDHCVSCHGAAVAQHGLRLDQKAGALAGGQSGTVIKPGDSANSKLIQYVSGSGKIVMPPVGPRLSAEQVNLLRVWVDQGANWPDSAAGAEKPAKAQSTHWAFQAPRHYEPPVVRKREWVRNPIDAFILARLESEGVESSPEADRATLIRRLSLDLIGLPPLPEELANFVSDNRPDAYERLVDRLLASPHYGEKWARHWLDLARYADSDGYETDALRPYAWRYRNWVIDAFNRNMPFDEFTIEQIAGDLLPNATVEQKVATGFHRNTLSNREGGADLEEYRVEQIVDRTSTVGTAWLGLTMGCARCHNHKYDPISQKEFYSFYAFFNNADEINIQAPLPGEIGPYLKDRPEYERKRREILGNLETELTPQQAEWEKKVLDAEVHPGKDYKWDRAWELLGLVWERGLGEGRPIRLISGGQLEGQFIVKLDPSKRTNDQRRRLFDYFLHWADLNYPERFEQLKIKEVVKRLDELDVSSTFLTQAPTVFENPNPRTSYVHIRGDFRSRGLTVEPGTPAVLPLLPADPKPSRLTLARWLVSRDNPLTARVTVNRIWQELFGAGLVLTSEDFGTQGARPTHPELLDWLATQFRDHGWEVKGMVKLIVTSATYRQSSAVRQDLKSRDPNNRLLARQSRLRLPAELVRDSALAVSGLLNTSVGGPSVRPPQPTYVSKEGYENLWPESKGADRYRRGMYIWLQRTSLYAQLSIFDAPDTNRTCSRRERSNTPLQALVLLNDPVFMEAAEGLAERVLREVPGGDSDRIRYAFDLCLARQPAPAEEEHLADYLKRQEDIMKREPRSVSALVPVPIDGVEPVAAAAWVGLSSVLLNMDEFVTRE